MKIMSAISAIEMRFKQSHSEEKKVEEVLGCAGNKYSRIIVITDGISWIESKRNATALELCKAMRNMWHVKGLNDDNKEDDEINNDSMELETSLGTVRDKQSLDGKQKCFNCGKIWHRSAKHPSKKKKIQLEKTGAAADVSIKKIRSKCSQCSKPGHKEEDCWKKYPHKAPSRKSTEALGMFLDEDLFVCNIAKDKMPYVTLDAEAAYYCVPII